MIVLIKFLRRPVTFYAKRHKSLVVLQRGNERFPVIYDKPIHKKVNLL
jgi:hypothetical protein